MSQHETTIPQNRAMLRMFNAVGVGILGLASADILSLTTVVSSNTTTGFTGMVGAKTPHESFVPLQTALVESIKRCGPTANGGANIYTNSGIAAADTLAGVRSIHTTADSSLTATDGISTGYPY